MLSELRLQPSLLTRTRAYGWLQSAHSRWQVCDWLPPRPSMSQLVAMARRFKERSRRRRTGSWSLAHSPLSSHAQTIRRSFVLQIGPIHLADPRATRSIVQGCSISTAPGLLSPSTRHVSSPRRQPVVTSKPWSQRLTVARRCSSTAGTTGDRHAVHNATVNGRAVARCDEVMEFVSDGVM